MDIKQELNYYFYIIMIDFKNIYLKNSFSVYICGITGLTRYVVEIV